VHSTPFKFTLVLNYVLLFRKRLRSLAEKSGTSKWIRVHVRTAINHVPLLSCYVIILIYFHSIVKLNVFSFRIIY
jgi:hypothetical protein